MIGSIRYIIRDKQVVTCMVIHLWQAHNSIDSRGHGRLWVTNRPSLYLVPLMAEGTLDLENGKLGAKVYAYKLDDVSPCEPTANHVMAPLEIVSYATVEEAEKHLPPVCPTCGQCL